MTRRRLCISSFQDWTGAALNRSIQGLIDHVDIGSVSTEQLLEQLKATLQLSQSVATAWYDGTTLDCAIAYYILLHQRDQVLRGVSPVVPLEEREHLRTAPFGASSLFDELSTKLQLATRLFPIQGLGTFYHRYTRAAPYRSGLGINLCQYLDYRLIYSPSHDRCLRDIVKVLNLCHTMDLLIHDKKSELIPKQKFLFSGIPVRPGFLPSHSNSGSISQIKH